MMLTKRDRERLDGVHPHLVSVIERAAETTAQPFMVLEGVRSVARQRELVARGASRTMNSRHIPGGNGYAHAVDIAPLVGGAVSWDWKYYHPLAKTVKAAAEALDVEIEWGGDWRSFKDGPHWQLPWADYPASAPVEVRDAMPMGMDHMEAHPPRVEPERFAEVIPLVLEHEGGFVNHKHDPGGATNKGITLATYRTHIRPSGTVDDLRALTEAQAVHVYRREYWDRVSAGQMPPGVDYAVFDYAVNSGNSRAARALQSVLGVAVDGRVGPVTLAAVRATNPATLVEALCDQRLGYLKSLSHWDTFGRGWSTRVRRVRAGALEMVEDAAHFETSIRRVPEPEPAPSPPRQPDDPGVGSGVEIDIETDPDTPAATHPAPQPEHPAGSSWVGGRHGAPAGTRGDATKKDSDHALAAWLALVVAAIIGAGVYVTGADIEAVVEGVTQTQTGDTK